MKRAVRISRAVPRSLASDPRIAETAVRAAEDRGMATRPGTIAASAPRTEPHAPAPSAGPQWSAVSRQDVCAICGAPEGCFTSADREFAVCARRPSEWPLVTGAWLHRCVTRSDELSRRP